MADPTFRQVERRVIHEGSVISVEVGTFVDPDGNRFERDIVRHPGAVSVVPVHDDRTVTLVRQYRAALDRDLLEIPAGKCDHEGEPREEMARRELAEEVGLAAGRLDEMAEFYNSPGFCDEHSTVFLATELTEVANDLQGLEEQHLEVVRLPLDDVPGLITSSVIVDAKTIIGVMLAEAVGMTATEDPAADLDVLPLDIEEFLIHLIAERGRSASTLEAYRRDLRRYWAWLRVRRATPAEATEADLFDHLDSLRGQGLAPSTVKRAMVAVRGLHRFLHEDERAVTDPGSDVRPPPVARGLPKALTEAEVEMLIEHVTGHDPVARRDRAILEVLYGTGIRISELVGLSIGTVDLDGALIRVLGKGDKERIVPVGRMALEALGDWLARSGRGAMEPERWRRRGDAEAVFLNQRGGRLSRQGAWLVVRGHGDAVGLADRLTPHVLRHSCATHMLDHGADIRAVQELLGHASITTQVYTLVSNERLFDAYQQAHPRASR